MLLPPAQPSNHSPGRAINITLLVLKEARQRWIGEPQPKLQGPGGLECLSTIFVVEGPSNTDSEPLHVGNTAHAPFGSREALGCSEGHTLKCTELIRWPAVEKGRVMLGGFRGSAPHFSPVSLSNLGRRNERPAHLVARECSVARRALVTITPHHHAAHQRNCVGSRGLSASHGPVRNRAAAARAPAARPVGPAHAQRSATDA
eukprot:scaffold47897_cov63-Phaeocystis_antarctica.AAC.3